MTARLGNLEALDYICSVLATKQASHVHTLEIEEQRIGFRGLQKCFRLFAKNKSIQKFLITCLRLTEKCWKQLFKSFGGETHFFSLLDDSGILFISGSELPRKVVNFLKNKRKRLMSTALDEAYYISSFAANGEMQMFDGCEQYVNLQDVCNLDKVIVSMDSHKVLAVQDQNYNDSLCKRILPHLRTVEQVKLDGNPLEDAELFMKLANDQSNSIIYVSLKRTLIPEDCVKIIERHFEIKARNQESWKLSNQIVLDHFHHSLMYSTRRYVFRNYSGPELDGVELYKGFWTNLRHVFDHLKDCPNVKILDLWNSFINDDDIGVIIEGLTGNRSISTLRFEYNEVTEKGIRELLEFAKDDSNGLCYLIIHDLSSMFPDSYRSEVKMEMKKKRIRLGLSQQPDSPVFDI